MALEADWITLADLLEERGETEQDEEILSRIKVLAQEHLPDGWTRWQVCRLSKEDIFGDRIDSSSLNKLVFALPTVGLVRAFNPDADHLSEKGYRELRFKLLDWAFARALIVGPPSIANKIRGSAARTELFKESVKALNPLLHTRAEADKILAGVLPEAEETRRKRRSTSIGSNNQEPSAKYKKISRSRSTSQDNRIDLLEGKMESMFSLLLEKIEAQRQPLRDSDPEEDEDHISSDVESLAESVSGASWRAPDLDLYQDDTRFEEQGDIEFVPKTKEADPLIPEPSPQIRKEGIDCQRFGSEGWSRIRYKDVEKHLQAAPVFSALKVNTELGSLPTQPSPWLSKQEGVLGTICHGLLLQRKTLAEELNTIRKKFPEAGEELRKLLSEDSPFKILSDQLLQYVCAHRAETIEMRRKAFKCKNDVITGAVQAIPPSPTHLFDEKLLGNVLKDNGGVAQTFTTSKFPERRVSKNTFRKPAASSHAPKGRQSNWHTRPSAPTYSATSTRTSNYRPTGSARSSNKYNGRPGKDKKTQRGRKY